MRTKLIAVTIFLGLLISPCNTHAAEKELSAQELYDQLVTQKDKLERLEKTIIDLEVLIDSIREKIKEFAKLWKEAKKEKLLEENPNQEINQSDLNRAYLDEEKLFVKSFFGVHDKEEGMLLEEASFKELEDKAVFLKFYIAKLGHAYIDLATAACQWEHTSEIVMEIYKKASLAQEADAKEKVKKN